MSSWLEALGIASPEPTPQEEPLAAQVHEVTKSADNSKMHYTPRDHDTLLLVLQHPVANTEIVGEAKGVEVIEWPRYCEVSNSALARLLGMTAGAAAARVARLVKMGVVKPWYEVAVETGKVNRRVLEMLQVPPTPWSPD